MNKFCYVLDKATYFVFSLCFVGFPLLVLFGVDISQTTWNVYFMFLISILINKFWDIDKSEHKGKRVRTKISIDCVCPKCGKDWVITFSYPYKPSLADEIGMKKLSKCLICDDCMIEIEDADVEVRYDIHTVPL